MTAGCEPGGDHGPSALELVDAVSHELRAPLTSVKGFTSLLLNRWDRLPDEQKRAMLGQVLSDADRVSRLLTELLDISRLETGRLHLRRQLVDLAAVATAVVEKVGRAHEDLTCELSFPDDLPHPYADPGKVEQVLTNLVENAAKYGDPRGVRVEATTDADAVAVAVADRGPGLPADELPLVFTTFFLRDHARPDGAGLGLWLSRALVEAHGGSLTVESERGRGTTFRLTLPMNAFDELLEQHQP